MPRRKIAIMEQLLPGVRPLERPQFSAGTVCEVLGLPAWRLHNFLKTYQLSSKEPGKGTRLWFTQEQLYRVAIAKFLADDGFSAHLIGELLDSIDDHDLSRFDEHDRVPHPTVGFWRTPNGTNFHALSEGEVRRVRLGSPVYYLLNVAEIVESVDKRIAALLPDNRQRRRRRNWQLDGSSGRAEIRR